MGLLDINNNKPFALTGINPLGLDYLATPLLKYLAGQPLSNNSTNTSTTSINGNPYTTSFVSGIMSGVTDTVSNKLFESLDDTEIGRNLGTIFSSGLNSAGNTITNNILKGELFSLGLAKDSLSSMAGAAAGIASNYLGLGITSMMGNSKLGKFTGQAASTIGGAIGGKVAQNLITGSTSKLFALGGAGGANPIKSVAGSINPYALGASAIGMGLQAAFGPSKEYGGKYGNITKTMDTIYDVVGFVPGIGQEIAAAMALNKGLSNIFGSTSGMCVCAGTKVFTSTGDIVNIEDLIQELGIIGWSEDTHEVRPSEIKGFVEPRLKECLEIELKNGTILRCSVDHPILSNIKEKAETHRINGKRVAYREWSFRRADELKVGNWVGLANNIDYWGDEEMPNAYLIGMLIGDGTYTYESSCKLWTADPSTWEYLEKNNLAVLIGQYTPENSNGKYQIENRDYRIINGMLLVKDLGIAYQKGKEKTFPKNLGKYNRDSICKMIAGLFDTDGSISVNEDKNSYKITLYQSNLNLLEHLKLLLLKLGIFSTIYTRKASINKMSNGRVINSNLSYRLEITDRNSAINFYKNIPLNIDYKKEHLERIYKLVLPKIDKDHCDLSGAKLYKIVSIKSIGILTVYNLEASKDHTYIANGIITHNTKTDAILGSAFMPAPVKWLNMAGAKKTGSFNNLSWLKSELTNLFMGTGFGNLEDKWTNAANEAGKTYGTFSRKAYKRAQKNLDYSNRTQLTVYDMALLNRYQNIRSTDMSSINNQRYAQNIQGGFSPVSFGKQGMKIFNNNINHDIGLRLLSGAALIDNKQMILCNVQD